MGGHRVRERAPAVVPVLDLRLPEASLEKEVLASGVSLDFQAQRVERVELVQRRLRARPVRVLRGLDRVDEKLDLLGGEAQTPEDDRLLRHDPVDRILDHVVGVAHHLGSGRPEEVF